MKRIVAVILAVCTALCLGTVASAEESHFKTLSEIIESWIDTQYQGEAEVSRIITLYDESGQNVGHLVTFKRDGLPAGYLVLSHMEDENPIFEFALHGENVYDYLECSYTEYETNVISTFQENQAEGESVSHYIVSNILYTDFLNYSLVIDNGDKLLLYDQNHQIKQIFGNNICSTQLWDGYEKYPDLGSNTVNLLNIVAQNRGLLMSDFAKYEDENNCGPTAMTNIIKLYAENRLNNHSAPLYSLRKNNSDKDTYDQIVNLSGYKPYKPAYLDELLLALWNFVCDQGYTCNIGNVKDSWYDYTSKIKSDLPILLYTAVGYNDDDFAHEQVVVGTKEFSSGEKYLAIYSGWYSQIIYVKYKADVFKYFFAHYVEIS